MSATLGFGDRAVASFYHSFNRTGATERTTIRLAFQNGHVVIDGWIPTRLEMGAEVPPEAVAALRQVLGDTLRTTDTLRAGGPIAAAVNAAATMPDRQDQYRLAVRAGMSDLIAAIDGSRPLLVTPADGLRSLDIAIRATL